MRLNMHQVLVAIPTRGAASIHQMAAGRLVGDCAVGLLSTLVGLLQSELVPASLRGGLTSQCQLMIVLGILVATLVDVPRWPECASCLAGWCSVAAKERPSRCCCFFATPKRMPMKSCRRSLTTRPPWHWENHGGASGCNQMFFMSSGCRLGWNLSSEALKTTGLEVPLKTGLQQSLWTGLCPVVNPQSQGSSAGMLWMRDHNMPTRQ